MGLLGWFVVGLVVFVVVFLILRWFWLWYWKINTIVSRLEGIRDELRTMNQRLEAPLALPLTPAHTAALEEVGEPRVLPASPRQVASSART